MYKFTNGVVVFTEEDKENYLKAGYVLVEEKKENDNAKKDDNGGAFAEEHRRSDRKLNKVSKWSK